MKLLMGSIFLCCIAESFSAFPFPLFGAISDVNRKVDRENPTTAKPEVDPRNPTNATLEVYWTFKDNIHDIECVKGKVLYLIEVDRNCRSYLKCESGNLPARIYCPPRQVFHRDTMNCEINGLCAGMTLEEREALEKPIHPGRIRQKASILDKIYQQEYTKNSFASQNETPEEMVINVTEDFLKCLLCVTDIDNDFQICSDCFRRFILFQK